LVQGFGYLDPIWVKDGLDREWNLYGHLLLVVVTMLTGLPVSELEGSTDGTSNGVI